jgi:hypothetical protein
MSAHEWCGINISPARLPMRCAMIRTAVIVACLTETARGGTVVTTNLPANTAIVNINAKQDGAANWNSGQDSWFQPFFTGGATGLLQYSIQPGTYSFRMTNPTLAAAEFPTLTGAQLGQIFTAWTYNSPWVTDYFVFNAAGASTPSVPNIFAGAIRPVGLVGGTASATQAFDFAVANNFDDNIVKQPGGRFTGMRANQYTFASAETLTFVIPDNILSDNNGGVSIVVSPAVPPNPQGDYNDNNVVDAADYVVWRNEVGGGNNLLNDAIGGTIGTPHYNAWRVNFGNVAVGSAVPEPGSLVGFVSLAAIAIWLRRVHRAV